MGNIGVNAFATCVANVAAASPIVVVSVPVIVASVPGGARRVSA